MCVGCWSWRSSCCKPGEGLSRKNESPKFSTYGWRLREAEQVVLCSFSYSTAPGPRCCIGKTNLKWSEKLSDLCACATGGYHGLQDILPDKGQCVCFGRLSLLARSKSKATHHSLRCECRCWSEDCLCLSLMWKGTGRWGKYWEGIATTCTGPGHWITPLNSDVGPTPEISTKAGLGVWSLAVHHYFHITYLISHSWACRQFKAVAFQSW